MKEGNTGTYDDHLSSLEFFKIKDRLKELCSGFYGAALCSQVSPSTDVVWINKELTLVDEARQLDLMGSAIPARFHESIEEEIKNLGTEGFVLSIPSLLKLKLIFRSIIDIQNVFGPKQIKAGANLFDLVKGIEPPEQWLADIENIIDDEGTVNENATPELRNIRKQIKGKNQELDKTFRSIVKQNRDAKVLADTAESIRNGRRVLCVQAEYKRKVDGIIHDESTTGRTAFIEPAEVVRINNDIVELEGDFKKEVYRILKEISARLHPQSDLIKTYTEIIGQFDLLAAKVRLAKSYKGLKPTVIGKPHLELINAYHPLLLMQNLKQKKVTVPFTLHLHPPNKLLLLSGPNAGGKSILMKAVGLMQAMAQSGLLIPASDQSTFGIFKRIFVDIGDQQSIENELSTYSSRLKNMKEFLEESDQNSLILIDEFGSGSDPKLGAAIAESLLLSFYKKKVFGVITTHYSNLKVFAFKNKGIVNGAMVFDKEKLEPTYQLSVGRPGSSFTFEIASKTGFEHKVIQYARKRAGKPEQALEDLLADLERKQQRIERILEENEKKRKKLDTLIKNYEGLSQELNIKKKKWKLEQKEKDLQRMSDYQKELEKSIRDIKAQAKVEEANKVVAKTRSKKESLKTEITKLAEEITAHVKKDFDKARIQVGSFVKMFNGTVSGQIQEIRKNKATVLFGSIPVTVPVKDLVPSKEPLPINPNKSVKTDVSEPHQHFETKLDLRGMRAEDAHVTLEKFMDKALMKGSNMVRIVHGKGSGALRKLVLQKLKEYDVKEYSHPEPEFGGDGVTIVQI